MLLYGAYSKCHPSESWDPGAFEDLATISIAEFSARITKKQFFEVILKAKK
jgi:hypothetical protein